MYDSNNEFSLDLFTDYRTQITEPVMIDPDGWLADFNTKTLTVSRPITFLDLYRGVADMMDEIDLMDYEMPFIAVTKNYFEVVGGWTFSEGVTRQNIREASWTEDGVVWTAQAEPNCVTFNVTGLSALDKIHIMPYNDS